MRVLLRPGPVAIPPLPPARAWLPLSSGTSEEAMHLVVGFSFQGASIKAAGISLA
jgi:hypothetical protein